MLHPDRALERPPAAAEHVDDDEDDADEAIAPADDLDSVDCLGIVELPPAPVLVGHAEPEAGHHLALPPADIGASVADPDAPDVQVVSVVDEDPHGLVDTDKVMVAVKLDGVLVPGHGMLRVGSWARDDQGTSNGLHVKLRGDAGRPGLLAQLGNDIGDGLHALLGDLLLQARGQAALDGHLGWPAAYLALEMRRDSPRAAGRDVGHSRAIARVQFGALYVAQPDAPLLTSHPTAVASGPVPEGGEEAEELLCVIVLDMLASVHKSHHDVLGGLHVHVIAIEEVPFLSAAQVVARVRHLGLEDNETEHPDTETLQHAAASPDMARVNSQGASKVAQDGGFVGVHVLLEVPDDGRDLFGLALARELEGHASQVSGAVKHQESGTSHTLEHIFFLFNCKSVENVYQAEEKDGSCQPCLHRAGPSPQSAEPARPPRPQQRQQRPTPGVSSDATSQGPRTHQLARQRWGLQMTPRPQRARLAAEIKQSSPGTRVLEPLLCPSCPRPLLSVPWTMSGRLFTQQREDAAMQSVVGMREPLMSSLKTHGQ